MSPDGLGTFHNPPQENVAQDAAEADLLHVRKVAPYFEELDAEAEPGPAPMKLTDIEWGEEAPQ